jgi:hypothetical protein
VGLGGRDTRINGVIPVKLTMRQTWDDPGARWHQGGRNQTSGDYAGVDAVFGLFAKLQVTSYKFQLTDSTFSVEVDDICTSKTHAVGAGADARYSRG